MVLTALHARPLRAYAASALRQLCAVAPAVVLPVVVPRVFLVVEVPSLAGHRVTMVAALRHLVRPMLATEQVRLRPRWGWDRG